MEKIFFAAGLRCPKERIFYYACGGCEGGENRQGVWLYPTREHAVAAVAITVLTEFKQRGMYSDWGKTRKLPNNTRDICQDKGSTKCRASAQNQDRGNKRNLPSVLDKIQDDKEQRKRCKSYQTMSSDQGKIRDESSLANCKTRNSQQKRKSPPSDSISSKRACQAGICTGNNGNRATLFGPIHASRTDIVPPAQVGGQEESAIVTEDTGSSSRQRNPNDRKEKPPERLKSTQASAESELPKLNNPDWMVGERDTSKPGWKVKRCLFFNSHQGCKYKKMCNNAHVATTSTWVEPKTNRDVTDAYAKMFAGASLYESSRFNRHEHSGGRTWHTSAIRCPLENVIYYAAGGSHATKSAQGVFWYPTEEDAKKAADGVLLGCLQQRVNTTKPCSSNAKRTETSNDNPPRKPSLSSSNVSPVPDEISPDDGSNVSGLSEPTTTTTAVAQGKFNSGHFFQNLSRAGNGGSGGKPPPASTSPPISKRSPNADMGQRGLPGSLERCGLVTRCREGGYGITLPFLRGNMKHPDAWMLRPPKYHPCIHFRESGWSGCKRGIECKFAHLFCTSEDTSLQGSPPFPGALQTAYQENWPGIRLTDDCLEVKKEIVDRTEWFTSCFRCPKEGTIYNSSGFGGLKSTQNIWWYRTRSDSIAAVEGVILTAFRERHLCAPWGPSRQRADVRAYSEDRQRPPHISHNRHEQDLNAEELQNNRGGGRTSSDVPPLPLEKNLQSLYKSVFGCNLPSTCFVSEESEETRDGKRVFTLALMSPADKNRMYFPKGNGGIELRGRWFYPDPRTAKLATFSVLAKDLEARGMIRSAREMLERRCHGPPGSGFSQR